jgi:hypothetical protein
MSHGEVNRIDAMTSCQSGNPNWVGGVYAGDVLTFSDLSAMKTLAAWAQDFCRDQFCLSDPPQLHRNLAGDALLRSVQAARKAFRQAAEPRQLVERMFAESGLDLADLASDRIILRIQPPLVCADASDVSVQMAPLALHRDTWATNLYAQINWWAPVFPVEPNRTMNLYPDLWATPVPNDSADFDLPRTMVRGRENMASMRASEVVPQATTDVDTGSSLPVLIAPGQIFAFSGQHAHASVVNNSDVTRFSIDVRTISIDDVRTGRGAPNVDGAAPWIAHRLFRRCADKIPLGQIVGGGDFVPYHQCAQAVRK